MKDTFRVEWADEARQADVVDCDGRDWLHWEQQTGESALDVVRRGGFTEWYAGAWAALHRAGRFDGTRGEFAEQAAYVLPAKADDPPDPTTPPEGTQSSA